MKSVYLFVFFYYHDNSQTTALSYTKCCVCLYLDYRKNLIEFQGHMSKVKVIGYYFPILYYCEIGPCW